MTDQLYSISLYTYPSSKCFIYPYSKHIADVTKTSDNRSLSDAVLKNRNGGIRVKFVGKDPWRSKLDGFVSSHNILIDLILAMQKKNMQLLCCADLNIRGNSAGDFFFQDTTDPSTKAEEPPQIACLQLANDDKIRVIRLPETDLNGLWETLRKYSIGRDKKYGVDVFKLNDTYWRTLETSTSNNVNARKLVMDILSYMDYNGWKRAVPFTCSRNISDRGIDSILFFRSQQQQKQHPRAFCAITLEGKHKIRLIGAIRDDPKTQQAFQTAVDKYWTLGVAETNRFSDSLQIKFHGNAWSPNTTPEDTQSARFMCGVIQELWYIGWRWHCALDLSKSVQDKSSFYFCRTTDDDGLSGGRIGCVQPKREGKVNLVGFPPSSLDRTLRAVDRVQEFYKHKPDMATIKFPYTRLHYSNNTDSKSLTMKVYNNLLRAVAKNEGAIFLGTADISGKFHSTDDGSYSLDTDVFFLWFPRVD